MLVHFEYAVTLGEREHHILAQTQTIGRQGAAHDPHAITVAVGVADDTLYLHVLSRTDKGTYCMRALAQVVNNVPL